MWVEFLREASVAVIAYQVREYRLITSVQDPEVRRKGQQGRLMTIRSRRGAAAWLVCAYLSQLKQEPLSGSGSLERNLDL